MVYFFHAQHNLGKLSGSCTHKEILSNEDYSQLARKIERAIVDATGCSIDSIIITSVNRI